MQYCRVCVLQNVETALHRVAGKRGRLAAAIKSLNHSVFEGSHHVLNRPILAQTFEFHESSVNLWSRVVTCCLENRL